LTGNGPTQQAARNGTAARMVVTSLAGMVAVACAVGPPASTRSVPLIPGGDRDSALVRADLSGNSGGPPPVDFEVDCSALPYAKGEERAFCYMSGRWAVLRHERGILVACGCGEFGGFVSWYGHDGTLRQTLVDGDVPKTLIADRGSLVCVTGLSHLGNSKADVRTFRLDGDRWHAVATTPLARDVDRIDVLADGSLRFELAFEGGAWRYRAGVVEPVFKAGR